VGINPEYEKVLSKTYPSKTRNNGDTKDYARLYKVG
jgi:hypothetical protein